MCVQILRKQCQGGDRGYVLGCRTLRAGPKADRGFLSCKSPLSSPSSHLPAHAHSIGPIFSSGTGSFLAPGVFLTLTRARFSSSVGIRKRSGISPVSLITRICAQASSDSVSLVTDLSSSLSFTHRVGIGGLHM